MHGAKAIMTADPPSRQFLRQRPTIIVESPLASKTDGGQAENEQESRKPKAERQTKKMLPHNEAVNPYSPDSNPSPLLTQLNTQGSKESLSSAEHDTYL